MRYRLFAFVLCAFTSYAQTGQLNLQPDSADGKDAHVLQYNSTTNYGTLDHFGVRYTGGYTKYRGFIEFDLSDLPNEAIITSASLDLYVKNAVSNNSMFIERCATSWSESTVTWSNQPSTYTSDVISISNNTSFPGVHSFDVTSHVKKMKSGENFGWRLRLQSESTIGTRMFYSSECTTATQRPKLIINYVMPVTINSATVTHESVEDAEDGSISVTAGQGNGTYSYQWKDSGGSVISTSATASDLAAGWYGLTVTDGLGNKGHRIFIVGRECEVLNIEIDPGSEFVEDTYVYDLKVTNGTDYGELNYGSSSSIQNSYAQYYDALGGTGYYYPIKRGLINIPLFWDPILHIRDAELQMKVSSVSGSNASNLVRITQDWEETAVNNYLLPSVDSTDTIPIAQQTSTNVWISSDVTSYAKSVQSDPSADHGWLLELQSTASYPRTLNFWSSDYSAGSRPKMTVEVAVNCTYAPMTRQVDGSFHRVTDGRLKFIHEELYEDQDDALSYSVYDDLQGVVMTHADQSKSVHFGDNRMVLDVSCNGHHLANGHYLLEVVNEKGDKTYLKFKVEDNGTSCN